MRLPILQSAHALAHGMSRSSSASRSRSRSPRAAADGHDSDASSDSEGLVPYHELTEAQSRTKRRRRLDAKRFLQKRAGTKDEALVKAFTDEAIGKKKPRGRTKTTAGASARDKESDAKKVIKCQTQLCADLAAHHKEPHPLLVQQHVEEIRAEAAAGRGGNKKTKNARSTALTDTKGPKNAGGRREAGHPR